MALADAFKHTEELYKEAVMEETWGHLAPDPKRAYSGYILFAYSAYGDITPVQAEFEGLPDSPWFFEDMNEFIGKLTDKLPAGHIYRFTGTYRAGKFKGRTSQAEVK